MRQREYTAIEKHQARYYHISYLNIICLIMQKLRSCVTICRVLLYNLEYALIVNEYEIPFSFAFRFK